MSLRFRFASIKAFAGVSLADTTFEMGSGPQRQTWSWQSGTLWRVHLANMFRIPEFKVRFLGPGPNTVFETNFFAPNHSLFSENPPKDVQSTPGASNLLFGCLFVFRVAARILFLSVAMCTTTILSLARTYMSYGQFSEHAECSFVYTKSASLKSA